MNYQELIEKALKGRPINAVSKAWGVSQPTLYRYARGTSMPDWNTGLRIAKEAGIDPTEAFEVFAEEERTHKVKNFKLQMGSAGAGTLAAVAGISLAVTLFLTPQKAEALTYGSALEKASTDFILC